VNQEILKWITKDDSASDHLKRRNITRVADQYESSGQWLLQSEEFKDWESKEGLQVFWLCGTGKSAVKVDAIFSN
jgi:hypothetical protein